MGAAAEAETISVAGDQGYEENVARELEPGSLIDLRKANIRVANSRNASPSETTDCEAGSLPVNPYPVRIYDSVGALVLGGRFDGEVPQASDWIHTYCNSSAIGLWDSPYGRVEGVRARRVWDGIRFERDSQLFHVNRVWLSEVRDDCVENDFLLGGMLTDSLLDGCFVGLSMQSPDETAEARAPATVTLAGLLMRLEPYLYRGETKQGFPLKVNEASPELVIYDSVFAMNDADVITASSLVTGWEKVKECDNNLFLWLSDRAWPEQLPAPPPCFMILTGGEARSAWEAARQNWIDCHFLADRFADDTAPDPSRCDRSTYGGQY